MIAIIHHILEREKGWENEHFIQALHIPKKIIVNVFLFVPFLEIINLYSCI